MEPAHSSTQADDDIVLTETVTVHSSQESATLAYTPPVLPRPVRIRVIARVAALVCDVDFSKVMGPNREREITRVRQLAAYLAHHWSARSTTLIGKHLGNRDHTTALHAIEATTLRLHGDEAESIKEQILRIHEYLLNEMKNWLPAAETMSDATVDTLPDAA